MLWYVVYFVVKKYNVVINSLIVIVIVIVTVIVIVIVIIIVIAIVTVNMFVIKLLIN